MIGAVGVAALAGSIAAEIALASNNNTVQQNCSADSRQCNSTGLDAAASGRTLTTWDRILWGVGALGAGVGAYLVLSSGSSTHKTATTLQGAALPGGAGVWMRGQF